MRRALLVVALLLSSRITRAQFMCSGQGWQDNQCADPFSLYYGLPYATGASYFDTNGKLTSDPASYDWSEGSQRLTVSGLTPGAANYYGYIINTDTGVQGGALVLTSSIFSHPKEYPNSLELNNTFGGPIVICSGGQAGRSSAYVQGQNAVAVGAFPSTAFGAQLTTTDTSGFLYIPTSNGIPTGTPIALPDQFGGTVPIDFDTAHSVLYCYNGSWAPCDPTGGSGTVTSVSGTTGRIVITPSSPNPVVDLATFGSSPTCAWANVVVDAWGRTTCTANTAPQPAGNYITALTHDVTATGPGSVAAEVTGITDSGSTDWQVTGTFSNGKALGFVGGGLQAVSFQTPLTACTDYVSLTCVTGATDLGGTNATPTVIGAEDGAVVRGALLTKRRATPSTPSSTDVTVWNGVNGIESIDGGATTRYMAKDVTCSGANVATSITGGILSCGAASVACSGLPALVGSANSSAGSCSTKVTAIDESGGLNIPIGACTTDGQAFVKVAGQMTCRLPAGDLSNDYTAPWVSAIHETSGPQQLTIQGIPDTAPFVDVLVRDSIHGNSIIGEQENVLFVADKLPFFMNVSAIPVSTGWISTTNETSFFTGQLEYPTSHLVQHVTLIINLISNGIVTGGPTISVTRNGAGVTGAAISYNSSVSPGVTSVTAVTGSASATDTYGIKWATSSTGSLEFTAQLVLN